MPFINQYRVGTWCSKFRVGPTFSIFEVRFSFPRFYLFRFLFAKTRFHVVETAALCCFGQLMPTAGASPLAEALRIWIERYGMMIFVIYGIMLHYVSQHTCYIFIKSCICQIGTCKGIMYIPKS